MKYINASKILPEALIENISEYVSGVYVYIPKKQENRQPWGKIRGVENY